MLNVVLCKRKIDRYRVSRELVYLVSMYMTISTLLIQYVCHKVSAHRCALNAVGFMEVCGPWCDTSAMSAASLHSLCVRTAPTKRIRGSP